MAKKNYSAWHIDSKSFSESWTNGEKLLFFARYALLAPSGHNTQPWLFKQQQDRLIITTSPSRNLPFSGSLAAEPHISLGSCLETLRLAAKGFGYDLAITYSQHSDEAAVVTISHKIAAEPELLSAITSRVSNRSYYTSQQPPAEQLAEIIHNDFSNLSIQVVSDAAGIAYLANQTRQATATIMHEPEFRAELSKWVRNNVTKQHDGMPGFVQGMPTPPSMLAKHIVRRIDISKGQAKTDANRVSHSPVIVLISAHDTRPDSFMDTGRMYARICVLAQRHGIATSGVGAAVIDPAAKQAIAEHFKLAYPPTALLRLGYATKPARHTPRWPLEQVSS